MRSEALAIADKFVEFLDRHCHRCVVAGSIRRRRPEVGDIEILFVPKRVLVSDPGDLFGAKQETSAADLALDALLRAGVIAKRPNVNDSCTWGGEQARDPSGQRIPVDFFVTNEERFWNALFVRTGPAALNKSVASPRPRSSKVPPKKER